MTARPHGVSERFARADYLADETAAYIEAEER